MRYGAIDLVFLKEYMIYCVLLDIEYVHFFLSCGVYLDFVCDNT